MARPRSADRSRRPEGNLDQRRIMALNPRLAVPGDQISAASSRPWSAMVEFFRLFSPPPQHGTIKNCDVSTSRGVVFQRPPSESTSMTQSHWKISAWSRALLLAGAVTSSRKTLVPPRSAPPTRQSRSALRCRSPRPIPRTLHCQNGALLAIEEANARRRRGLQDRGGDLHKRHPTAGQYDPAQLHQYQEACRPLVVAMSGRK